MVTRYLVELRFPADEVPRAEAFAAEMRALGFAVEIGETLEKSEGLRHFVNLIVAHVPAALGVAGGIKTVLEIPGTIKKLREKLEPLIGRVMEIAPEAQIPLVCG